MSSTLSLEEVIYHLSFIMSTHLISLKQATYDENTIILVSNKDPNVAAQYSILLKPDL